MRFLVVSLTVFLLLGCSRPAEHVKAASPATLQSGWTEASDPDGGMTLGVAPGWHTGVDVPQYGSLGELAQGTAQSNIDPNNPGDQMAQQIQKMDKEQEKQALADLKSKGIAIQVLDSSKPTIGEERTRYYVKKVDHGSNYGLDLAGQDEKDHLRGMGADDPTKVDLPIGPALKFTADHKTIGGDEVTHISYVVVDGRCSYHLRFVSTNSPTVIQSIADQVARSWRITPTKP